MKLIPTDLPDVMLVEPSFFADERGWFMESFNAAHLDAALNARGLPAAPAFVQDNHSCSRAGVLRGLHYQVGEMAQGKLVRVLQGEVLDVVVDLRTDSPTYGQAYKMRLSADNKRQLWVPRGLAHGYIVLSETAEFFYKCDNYYSRGHEGGLRYDDPLLNIHWGVSEGQLVLSEKDRVLPFFGQHLQ